MLVTTYGKCSSSMRLKTRQLNDFLWALGCPGSISRGNPLRESPTRVSHGQNRNEEALELKFISRLLFAGS